MDRRDKKSYKKMVIELVRLLGPKKDMIEEWLKKTYPKSYKDDMILYLGSELRFHLGVLPVPGKLIFLLIMMLRR